MMITSAETITSAALHAAALDAFSDYIAPFNPDLPQFEASLRQRDFDPALSRLAIEAGEITAFWLMARRGARAYLIQSGTRPAARRRGLSLQLGQAAEATARAAGCTEITAEVICTNERALPLYDALGFAHRRRLDCFRVEENCPAPALPIDETRWSDIAAEAATFTKIAPSWQNAPDGFPESADLRVRAIRHEGALAAFMVSAGASVMALATRADMRRKGMASALIAAQMEAENPSYFINIDTSAQGFSALMQARGIAPFLSQWELHKAL